VIGEDLRRNYAKSGFVADRHSDLRYRSGFEPPLSKSIGRALIENRITAALLHGRIGYFAARGINRYNANPVAGDMVVLRLVGVHGERAANDHSFCRRQRRQSCVPFYPSSFCFRRGSWRCRLGRSNGKSHRGRILSLR